MKAPYSSKPEAVTIVRRHPGACTNDATLPSTRKARRWLTLSQPGRLGVGVAGPKASQLMITSSSSEQDEPGRARTWVVQE